MTKQQQRVIKVLERMIEACKKDEDDADIYSTELEGLLTNLHGHDFYGSEGAGDPRGDFRGGDFSMWHVEGVDG